MNLPASAFQHLPELRDRIIDPECSEVRMTAAVMERFDQMAADIGYGSDWRWSDERLQETFTYFMQGYPSQEPVWIFAYGSLMWDPGIHFDRVCRATLDDFQRRFAFSLPFARGSEAFPALMLSLEQIPGPCHGLAYRIAADVVSREVLLVWRREMIQGHYTPSWETLTTEQGRVRALVFGPNAGHPRHVGTLPLEQSARQIAQASGPLGSNAQYLHRLADQLRAFSIDDDYVQSLDRRVSELSEAVE